MGSEPESTVPTRGQRLGGGVEVTRPGAGDRLAGPGTGRAVSPAADARSARPPSYDVAAFPMPTGREEEWRFSPLDRLRALLEDRAADGVVELDATVPSPLTLERVPREDPRVGAAFVPGDRAAAIAFARTDKPLVLSVPPGLGSGEATLVFRGTGGVAYDHLVVDVGREAALTLVLDHVGTASFGANVEYLIGDGARLTVVSLQDWDGDAVHVGQHVARVGRDATLRAFTVTLGGDLVRLAPRVVFADPGGDAELFGLYFADAGQHFEHRLFIDHAVAQCRSRVTYKGALQGTEAHTVWIGDVLIRPEAVGTDTYELNRNLLLTEGARADSVPNLEIETGEVAQAGHASTTGRFDDEQLFYLMARGIPEAQARRLVVRGFFFEVLARLELPELRERLTAEIDAELEAIAA